MDNDTLTTKFWQFSLTTRCIIF